MYAHRQNVVHRDIKPANILLDGAGDGALLGGCGLAAYVAEFSEVNGTPGYIPPELLRGQPTNKSDVFSLAATLRRPETANSLAMSATTIQAGASPISTRAMKAAEVKILSAAGSSNLPSRVTNPRRRAKNPSRKSVSDATRKTPRPTNSLASNLVRRTATKTGTSRIRMSERILGRLKIIGQRLGPD